MLKENKGGLEQITDRVSPMLADPQAHNFLMEDIEEDYGTEENDPETMHAFDDSDEAAFDEDEDDLLNQAKGYLHSSISEMLDGVIQNFFDHKLSPEELFGISKLAMLVKSPEKFKVDGYVSFTVKEIKNPQNFTFIEIQFDWDALSLTKGGYATEEDNGGDSYSDTVCRAYNEDEAIGMMDVIDSFVEEFADTLSYQDSMIEVLDYVEIRIAWKICRNIESLKPFCVDRDYGW